MSEQEFQLRVVSQGLDRMGHDGERPEMGQPFQLSRDTANLIGRSVGGQQIEVKGKGVSGQHAKLEWTDGKWVVTDLESSAGTFVNTQRISQEVDLQMRDVVGLGGDGSAAETGIIGLLLEEIGDQTQLPDALPEAFRQSGIDDLGGGDPGSIVAELNVGARLSQQTLQRRYEALAGLARTSTGDKEEREVADLVLKQVLDAFPGAQRAVLANGPNKADIVSVRFQDDREDLKVPHSKTIATMVLEEKLAVSSADAGSDVDELAIDGDVVPSQSIVDSGTHAMMAARIVVNDKTIGYVFVDTTDETTQFETGDLEVLADMSAQGGVMLENVRLQKQNEEQLKATTKKKMELKTATEIQQNLLPSPETIPQCDQFEIAGSCEPALEVAGDVWDTFYYGGVWEIVEGKGVGERIPVNALNIPGRSVDDLDALPLDHDVSIGTDDKRVVYRKVEQMVAVSITDISGKGVGAGVAAADCQGMIRGVMQGGMHDLAQVEGYANREMYKKYEMNPFAAHTLLALNLRTREVSAVSAGGARPVVRHPDGEAQHFIAEMGGSIPLGIGENSEYEVVQIPVQDDTLILLYTDGVDEAPKEPAKMEKVHRPDDPNADNDGYVDVAVDGQYGHERAMAVVNRHEGSAEELRAALIADVNAIKTQSTDDTTVVVVKVCSYCSN